MRTGAKLWLVGWLWLAVGASAETNSSKILELHVKNVVYLHATQSPVVILVDKDEKSFLPIWIGPAEAQAIFMEMRHFKPPRPMTHDLIENLVRELDGKVENLLITETKANTYFANLSILSKGKTKNIDCRPSDGIAIALRANAPILVSASVMKNALPFPQEEEEGEAQRVKLLGLTVQTLTADLADALELGKAKGVLVSDSRTQVVQRGDVILAVGDSKVETVEQLTAAVGKMKEGKDVSLKLLRQGKTLTVTVRLSEGNTPEKELTPKQ